MKITRILITAMIAASLLIVSCARQPSYKRSSKIINHYFEKYGKKYPDTIYSKNAVTSVEITSQEEIHKHLIAVEAFITLKDGTVQRIHATIERGPIGWRFVSWENAS